MKKQSRLQIVLIATAVITVVLGIVAISQGALNSKPQSSQLDGVLLYNEAIQEITNRNEFSYYVQTEKKIITEKNIYTESRKQNIGYTHSGAGDFQFSATDTLSVGDYEITTSCRYDNGTAYLSPDKSRFSARLSQIQLQKQYVPAKLLTPSNYGSIYAYPVSTGTVVYFTSASAAEPWAENRNMAFQQASGIAQFDKEGILTETVYCITYKADDSVIEKTVTIKPAHKSVTLEQINTEDYTPVSSLNAPLALELACGYLLQSNTISAQATDTITCDAFDDRYIQNITLNYTRAEDDVTAVLHTNLLQQNSSRGGEIIESTQTLTFSDGSCSVSINNASPVTDSSITQETMLKYCQDVLIGSILLPNDIVTAIFTETNTQYRYDFTATEDLATRISEKACIALYNDAAFLQKLASSYTYDGVNAYIVLDKTTLVPIASGISYKGTYVIDDFLYVLSYTAEQTYN